MVDFRLCHRRIWRIDHHITFSRLLDNAVGMKPIALFFDVAEIFGLRFHVFHACLMGMQKYVAGLCPARNFLLAIQCHGLGDFPMLQHYFAKCFHVDARQSMFVVIQILVAVFYGIP